MEDCITVVWRTDVHLAVSPPQSRIDEWATTVLGKLAQVGEIAREVGASAVIDGGDFFHVKTPSRTSHELVQRVAHVHAAYPCPVYALQGNHDVKYGDITYLDESALGVLLATGVFKILNETHHLLLEQDGIRVRIAGVPYHGTSYDWDKITSVATKTPEDQYLMVAGHLLASKSGGDMFGGEDILKYKDLFTLDPDVWSFGHWHKNQGVYNQGNKSIINIGSLTRGALSQDEISRIPEVAIIRFYADRVEIEQRPLKVAPAEEVFDLVGRVQEEARESTIGAFVDSIETALSSRSEASLLDDVRAMRLPSTVEERLLSYLEGQGAR